MFVGCERETEKYQRKGTKEPVGTKVLFFTPTTILGFRVTKKLTRKYIGPFESTEHYLLAISLNQQMHGYRANRPRHNRPSFFLGIVPDLSDSTY